MFKFLKLPASYYAFYGDKTDYYEDSFAMPIIGTYTPSIPNLYLLPSSDGNNVWFRLTYDFIEGATANLLTKFNITQED
jgi:hypothetical protein